MTMSAQASSSHPNCGKSRFPRFTNAVEEILGEIAVLPFDVPAGAEYWSLRSELEAAGMPLAATICLPL